MKSSFSKLLFFVMIVMLLVLPACAPKAPAATQPPVKLAAPTETAKPTQVLPTETPKNLVTSLDDAKNATIQIEAQGTFEDPQVGLQLNSAGRGSGFIIDPSGVAVTNNHVVTGSALLKVWVGGNKDKVYSARVLGASECSDLAVIKLEGSDFPYVQWHEGDPKVGLEVYAAGYPLGDPEFTMTKGIVSKANADGRTDWASVESVLEHDARINPGNSGGPLLDAKGQVVGINYASNSSNQYFAIGRKEADKVLSELQKGSDVNSIGINGQAVLSDDKTLSGVWVSSVKSGSPADKSGVKSGDIIMQVEGLVLATDGTMADYCQILRSHKPTDTLSMTVLRFGTSEILEGQLNGRELKVTSTFNSGGQTNSGSNTGSTGTTGSTSDVTKIADDSNVITMEVPNDWEYNGSPWNDTWSIGNSTNNFTAQTLTASPNVKDYGDGWTTPGIFIATSRDWGSIGGYANLLEGVRDFYKECKPNGQQKYKDDTYEGMMQKYAKCGGTNMNTLVLAARPIHNSSSYLLLVEIKYETQADLDQMDTILTSTEVNP
jgi:serine protease Do